MDLNQPLVSVLTFPYNKNSYAIESIENLQKQTYKNIEHIIIDDNSKDDTVRMIQDWIDKHSYSCNFIVHEQNKGLCATFNEAIKLSKGKYITFLSDDLWTENRLADAVRIMEEMPDTVQVYFSNIEQFNEDFEFKKKSFTNCLLENGYLETKQLDIQINNYKIIDKNKIQNLLFYVNPIFAPTLLIDKTIFDKIGLYDEKLFFEDYDFYFRASEVSDFCYHNSYNVFYRLSNAGISFNSRVLIEESILKLLDKHKSKIKTKAQQKAFDKNKTNTATSLLASYAHQKNWKKYKDVAIKQLLPNIAITKFSTKKLLRSLWNWIS